MLDASGGGKGKHGRQSPLKIDTGFHRLGAVPEQLPSLLEAFSHYPNVKMEGMFTHFAAADAADDAFVDTQVLRFQQAERMVQQAGFTPIVHISNSAATLRRPELRRDMVRAGIILYGYMPSEEMPERADLWPAMSWKSMVLDIHTIEPGGNGGVWPYLYCARAKKGCYLAGGICRRISSGAFQ